MFLERAPFPSGAAAAYDSAASRWWNRDELRAAAADMAGALARDRKSLAFCFCRNDIGSIAAYLGAVEAGHAVALLDGNLNDALQQRLIDAYHPEIILSTSPAADFTAPYRAATGPGARLWIRDTQETAAIHPDLSVLLSTSGTTGSPKFVRLSRANVESNAASIAEALEISSDERAITSLPFHYSYGLSVLNSFLVAGGRLVLTNEGLMSTAFWETVRTMQCTTFAGVPYSYQILNRLDLEKLDVPSLHTLTQAGGKLNPELIVKFSGIMRRRGGRFFVMYGQTEATARIAILPSSALPGKLGSAGLAIPGGALSIRVGDELTTAADMPGELIYTGPNVMLGYATSRADLELGDVLHGRLETGDMARFDRDGCVYISGRMTRDAKLFGLRVNLDDVESLLRANGPTAVVGGPEKLFIFCEYGDASAFERYRAELAAKLRVHYRAFDFRRVERLPLNPNGKIDYGQLSASVADPGGRS
jgi:acyl-CoA synthetase (AMP-forming)/AMP-acid ligase II